MKATVEFELELDRFGKVDIVATGETCREDIDHGFAPEVLITEVVNQGGYSMTGDLNEEEFDYIYKIAKSELEGELV